MLGKILGWLAASIPDNPVEILARSTFKAQWLPYLPPDWTSKNSAFRTQGTYMCFVWIWQQTAITS
jgi:hypothetical protein